MPIICYSCYILIPIRMLTNTLQYLTMKFSPKYLRFYFEKKKKYYLGYILLLHINKLNKTLFSNNTEKKR